MTTTHLAAGDYNALDSDPFHTGDTLYGTNGNDIMHGTLGDDVIYGLRGNDKITDTEGFDTLYGGAGNDHITSSSDEHTVMYGGAGNDVIHGYDANAYGGQGNDYIEVLAGMASGGAGNDQLTFYDFSPLHRDQSLVECKLTGGVGNDTLAVQNDDLESSVSSHATLVGGAGDDAFKFTLYSLHPDHSDPIDHNYVIKDFNLSQDTLHIDTDMPETGYKVNADAVQSVEAVSFHGIASTELHLFGAYHSTYEVTLVGITPDEMNQVHWA